MKNVVINVEISEDTYEYHYEYISIIISGVWIKGMQIGEGLLHTVYIVQYVQLKPIIVCYSKVISCTLKIIIL